MKEVKFYRIVENNVDLVNDTIMIDNVQITKENIKQFVLAENNYCFMGIMEKKVVAFLYGYGMKRPDGKEMFYIHSVDVLPDYQNNGIGTKLIEYVLKYIKDEKKYDKFFVLTEDENIRACKVYQKFADKEGQVLFSKSLNEV